ncbi:MAG: hypothetical protein M1832_005307 [Thelocarpon impressellum]|nr:MAG: hypothetical protein M1832_005307 [Thelocarpon impressellum]
MFGAICAGQPVQTNLQALSPTQYTFTVPSIPPFNHLVLFILPGTVLPPDTAAAVYIRLAPGESFALLGAIGNEKPSAVFRIKRGDGGGDEGEGGDAMTDTPAAGEITLGISIEAASALAPRLAALKPAPPPSTLVRLPPSTKVLAQRIITDAFNFLASFGGSGGAPPDAVPLKSFRDWWAKFEKRLDADPGFLEREAE